MGSKPVAKKDKSIHEDFAKFFEAPTRDKFRQLIRNRVGELDHLDFKRDWPESWSKTAKHILGLSNSGGGCLVIGVQQSVDNILEPSGVTQLADKADISKKLKAYLPSLLSGDIEVIDFSFDASEYPSLVGKSFQVLIVEDLPEYLPFVSSNSGSDIREGSIYIRRGTSTEEANYEELQRVVNRRIATNNSSQTEIDLSVHFDQLKFLYGLINHGNVIPKNFLGKEMTEAFSGLARRIASSFEAAPNPLYPKESIEKFVSRLIEKKKKKIEIELQVERIDD